MILAKKTKRIVSLALIFALILGAMLPAFTEEAYAFSGKKGSQYTVYEGGQIWYGSGAGGYSNSRVTDLGDDLGTRYSYCVQPDKPSPPTGTVTVDIVIDDDADTGKWNALRNICYYSPSYPGYDNNVKNVLSEFYTGDFNLDWGVAHMAMSYIYKGRPDDMETYGGTWASDLGDVWTKAKKMGDALWKDGTAKDDAVPDSFKVFICKMSGVQDMVVGYMESPGYLKMTKGSGNTTATDGNNCYSLEGAEYTVYSGDSVAGVLTLDANGESKPIELAEGTYTVKETVAPKGYARDENTYTVKVYSEDVTTFDAVDVPIMNIVDLLLTKRGPGAIGDASLEGAVYRFSYYDGYYDSPEAAEASGNAKAVWYFDTNSSGRITGNNPKPVSGYESSPLYTDNDGNIAFPLGTYVVEEVKAPEGFIINPEKLLTQITEDGTDNPHVKSYNEKLESVETMVSGGVKVGKIDRDRNKAVPQGDATLEGAEFIIFNNSNGSISIDGKEYAKGDAVLIIKTDKKGVAESGNHDLPYGSYIVKETKAPTGYFLNESWSKSFSIETDGEVKDFSEEPVDEPIHRGGVKISKIDADLDKAYAQGDATLEGAEFTIYNNSEESVFVNNKEYGKGQAVLTIKTDKDGNATTANNVLPYGTYAIKETKSSRGYLVNNDWNKIFQIREPEKIVDLREEPTEEAVIRGGVKVGKIDNDLDEAYTQGDASFKDVEFTIYNESVNNVFVDGKEYAKGEAVMVIKTDEKGIATTSHASLPYGSYSIKETKAPEGYIINTTWSKSFTIREQGKIIDLTVGLVREEVIRSGVQIVKQDKELGKSEALGGATLDGIAMTIKNVSNHDVVVRSDFMSDTKVDWKKLESKKALFEEGIIKRIKTGEDVGTIIVHWNDEKKAYTAETLSDDLPYGTYTIRESKTNSSYQRTDKTEHKFEVREDGTIYSYDGAVSDTNTAAFDTTFVFDNYVYRSDVQGTKIADSTSERFSYVPFKITSLTNGETHVVVTDSNGFFSTKDRRTQDVLEEDEKAENIRAINPFDDLLSKNDITTKELEERTSEILMGVWFGTGEFGSTAETDSNVGALPYDSYIIEELHCEQNEGYTLQKFRFTVDAKTRKGLIDLETITDDVPEIGTVAAVNGKKTDIKPEKEMVLVDTIAYEGFTKGETYLTKGILMDKATGNPALDPDGNEITAEAEFVAKKAKGKVKVEFTFDATSLYGKDVVVFETVYDAAGYVFAKHEDIEDEDQTVTFRKEEEPKIGTTLTDEKGAKTVVASKETVLIDKVSYEGLYTDTWYTATGTLMVKETGDLLVENGTPVSVESEPFKPNSPDGEVEIRFVIDTTGLEGKELVAFEVICRLDGYKKGDDLDKVEKKPIAEHKDLEDEGQTVKVEKPEEPKTLEEPKTPDTPKTPTKTDAPKTGDNSNIGLYICLLTLAASALVVAKRKKTKAISPDGEIEDEPFEDVDTDEE